MDLTQDERSAFVYRLTNTVTGKCYIGICASKVQRRWRRHCNSAAANKPRNRNCPALHGAIRKYGEAVFNIETLYQAVNWKEACKVERGLIAQYGTMAPNGYNLTSGGEGLLGLPMSEANKRLNSLRSKGKPMSPETRAKISEAARLKREAKPPRVIMPKAPRRYTAETRAKMSAWQIGKKHSAETKAKIAAKAVGRKKTPEQIEEMRQREFSPAHRAKIKAALKGREFSQEWRARISEGLRRRWARHAEANNEPHA